MEIIGMEKQAAIDLLKNKGFNVRVVSEDGKNAVIIMNINPNRFNLNIVNGKVISFYKG